MSHICVLDVSCIMLVVIDHAWYPPPMPEEWWSRAESHPKQCLLVRNWKFLTWSSEPSLNHWMHPPWPRTQPGVTKKYRVIHVIHSKSHVLQSTEWLSCELSVHTEIWNKYYQHTLVEPFTWNWGVQTVRFSSPLRWCLSLLVPTIAF